MTQTYIVKKKQVFEYITEVEAESREHAEALAGEMDIPTDEYEQVSASVSAKRKPVEPKRADCCKGREVIYDPLPFNKRLGMKSVTRLEHSADCKAGLQGHLK